MKSNRKGYKERISKTDLSISEHPESLNAPACPVLLNNMGRRKRSHGGSKALSKASLPMARDIEHWPLNRLTPYVRNPRIHSDAQVAQIAGSILEFGFVNPILVDSDAGILAGHGRLLAARKLQLPHVPVIVLDHLTENQKRAYVIVDNRLAENAQWDEELLRLELAALQEQNFPLDLTGFEDEDLARFMAQQEPSAGLTDEDGFPNSRRCR